LAARRRLRRSARAQQPGRIYRLGILHFQGRQAPQFPPFFDELRELGFVEGRNLIVDGRGYSARAEQFPALAAELVKAGVDAFLCGGVIATRAAQEATRTIPILTLVDDMVAAGLTPSLARPGGNVTGISFLATELDSKRLEILLEMVPNARRVAVLADADLARGPMLRALQDIASASGVELLVQMIDRPERIGPAIDEARRQGATALNVLASPMLYTRRLDIFDRTTALRMPAIYQWAETAEEGGLAGYGPRITQLFRQLAGQLAKVLRGTKPADLPVQQPTTFELVINLKAAKAIGHEIPAGLVLRADKVIE
jgi:putative ABC transport system substrate-binding protein